MRVLQSVSRRSIRRIACVNAGLFALLTLTARTGQTAARPRESVASLAWLAGCWVEDLGPITVLDEWTAPDGDTMLGVSRTRQGDSTVALELRTISDSGGILALTTIGARRRFRLRAGRSTASSIEFLDAAHQTIVRFSRDSLRQLELTSERRIGGSERTLNELFQRVSCGERSIRS